MNVSNRADISQVLAQMRSLKTQMSEQSQQATKANQAVDQLQQVQGTRPVAPQGVEGVSRSDAPSFGDMFQAAVDTVNDQQKMANDLRTRYEMGDPSVDLPEVMIAAEKSSVAFQALTQTRNKVVEAYKEIMNMPI